MQVAERELREKGCMDLFPVVGREEYEGSSICDDDALRGRSHGHRPQSLESCDPAFLGVECE